MNKYFNLKLFEDGNGGNSGGNQGGNNAGNGNGGQNAGGSYSYQQAEEIAQARAERAEKSALSSFFRQKGMTEDEITQAIADFKTKRDAQKPNVSAITKERDDARAELAQLKNSETLRKKGVRDEDADYVLFKVNAMMAEDDKLDFDKATTKFLKENPRFSSAGSTGYRVKTGTDGNGAGAGGSEGSKGNDFINNAIRRAARR